MHFRSGLVPYRHIPCCWLLAVWPILVANVCCGAEEAPPAPATAADAATWVSKLNSDDFDERNTASDNLAKMGEAAREALEKGAHGADPEIKAAAADLLGKLSQATVTLLAVDRSGKPLPGISADLTIYKEMNPGNQQPQAVTTKADGTDMLMKTEPAFYNLYFNWKKAAAIGSNGTRLKLVPGINRVVVQITQGGSCETRALDADGKPLKDAKLQLSPSIDVGEYLEDPGFQNRFGSRPEFTQSTDEKGKVKIENLPDGVYRLVWTHEACEPTLGAVIRIREGQTTTVPDATLRAKSRGSLQLTLSSNDGKPLEKTHFFVSLTPASDDPAIARKALKAEYQHHMYDNGQPLQQTDEKGKVTLENLKPGKFHVLIRTTAAENQRRGFFRGNGNDTSESMVEFSVRDVEIKPGAKAEFTLKPAKGGVLKGRVVNEKGDACRDVSLSLVEEDYLVITGVQVFTQNYYDPAGMHSRYAQNKADGTFELKGLRPGKYALSVHGRTGEQVIVYGVVVAGDGKTTDLPEVKLPTPKKAFGEIKGKVLLSTGAPATSATVNLETVSPFGSSSSGINTNQKGEFNFNMSYYNMGYLPTRIRVQCSGYHPATVDLSAPDLKLEDITINLRKRDYGKLRVKTVDEAGKPVAGVQVWPTAGNPNMYAFGRQGVSRMQRTNAAGEVHFAGLADGPRKLQVEMSGYFTDPDATANVVKGDDETLFTVTLHTGLKIAGHLEAPAGLSAANASIMLADRTLHTTLTSAGADGAFMFSGLAPGTYTVTTELAGCGMTTAKVTLDKDQKDPAKIAVKPVRNGGIALNIGAAHAGSPVVLYPEAAFKNGQVEELMEQNRPTDTVDGSGRSEFTVPDGTYRVLISDIENNYDPDYGQRNAVSVMRRVASVSPQKLASAGEIGKLEAIAATFTPATGTAILKLNPQFPPEFPKARVLQPIGFVLLSSDIFSTFYFSLQDRQQPQAIEPLIVGTPPKELQNTHNTELFTIEHLPPGDYKLFQMSHHPLTNAMTVAGGKPITEFSLKEGQKLDLNDLTFNVPIPSREELEQAQHEYYGYDGMEDEQDKVEVFKP